MGRENVSPSKPVLNVFVLDLKWRLSLSESPLHSHFGEKKKKGNTKSNRISFFFLMFHGCCL